MVDDGYDLFLTLMLYPMCCWDDPAYHLEGDPEGRLFLIVGADHADLPGWHRPERVRELATVVVAPRPGAAEPGTDVVALQMEPVDLASTAIRQAVGRGEDLGDAVPEAVASVIAAEGLYRQGAC